MLSNNTFLQTRIQRLLYGLIIVEKGRGVHVQRMLKMSSVYTLTNILSKIFAKKRREIGDLIYDHGFRSNDLVQPYFLFKYIMRALLARLTHLH